MALLGLQGHPQAQTRALGVVPLVPLDIPGFQAGLEGQVARRPESSLRGGVPWQGVRPAPGRFSASADCLLTCRLGLCVALGRVQWQEGGMYLVKRENLCMEHTDQGWQRPGPPNRKAEMPTPSQGGGGWVGGGGRPPHYPYQSVLFCPRRAVSSCLVNRTGPGSPGLDDRSPPGKGRKPSPPNPPPSKAIPGNNCPPTPVLAHPH